MADSKIQIIIEAIDKASGTLGGIGGALGGLGKAALGLAGGAAIAGIGALGAGLGIAVSEAMEASEGEAQLGAVLKSTGGAAGVTADMALTLAGAFQTTTRFTDDEVLAGENILLTFTGIGKDVFPDATKTLLDMATAMGTDAKGGAIQLGKALNDPMQGLTSLTRVGVVFTDAQKEQIEAMTEAGDVAGAQKVILAELQKEFGGSAEAAGKTLPGQMDILKNSLNNTLGEAGATILPIFIEALQGVTPIISDLFTKLSDFLKSEGFRAFLTEVGDFLTTKVIPAISDLVNWLGTVLPPIFDAVAWAWTNVLYPAIQIVWDILTNYIFPVFVALADWLSVKIPAFVQGLKTIWDENFLGIQTLFSTVWENIKLAWQAIKQLFEGDFSGFGETIRTMFDNAFGAIKEIGDKVLQAFKDIDWLQLGTDIVTGIANGITGAVDWAIQAIIGLGGAVLAAIRGFLGISSPSKLMADMIGKPMAEGLMLGFADNLKGANFTAPISRAVGGMPRAAPVGIGSGGGTIIYAPMFSTASQAEVEAKLKPLIRRINRTL